MKTEKKLWKRDGENKEDDFVLTTERASLSFYVSKEMMDGM